MKFKNIIYSISIIAINDIITNNLSINITYIYYTRLMIIIIIYLLFDIFRIYQDYLDVSKELAILSRNLNLNKLICEEVKYNNILINTILEKLIYIDNKIDYIENKIKKIKAKNIDFI